MTHTWKQSAVLLSEAFPFKPLKTGVIIGVFGVTYTLDLVHLQFDGRANFNSLLVSC